MNIYVKRFCLVVLPCFFLFDVYAQEGKVNRVPVKKLEVRVIDQETGESIPNVLIYIGTAHFITNASGYCVLPFPSDSIRFQSLGYETLNIAAGQLLKKKQPVYVALSSQSARLDEVIIEAERKSLSRNVVVEVLSEKELRKGLGNSLAASLEQVKGVSTIQTGATLAKPVIHGMYSNRILILNNGVRQQGQQWGDDHAPEIDMNNAGSIRVIKGAESVKYGSQALGGVIDLESKPLPYGGKNLRGSMSAMYGTNGRRGALTGEVDGAFPLLKDWAWRVQGTYINGGDRSTANYLLNNTGMREADFSVALGYKKVNYGADLLYSRFDTRLGTLFASQMGDVELLKERIALGRPIMIDPFSRRIDVPNQKVIHQLMRVRTFFIFNNQSMLNLQYSFQTDRRDEYHARRNNASHIPSLSLDLTSSQLEVGWKHQYLTHWRTDLGLFYGYTNNANKPGTGVVPVIPNYTDTSSGLFLVQKYTQAKWGAELGVRLDNQVTRADGIDAYSQRYGGKRAFANFTYNVGANYKLSDNIHLISNLGTAWRAPHVHELYSNGLDHASGIYSVGDSILRSERSTKWITSLNYASSALTFSMDFYLQWVKNYIYDEPSKEYMTVVSGTYPVFRYKQVNAFFRGVDGELVWKPLKRIEYGANASFIWVNETHTGRYLPYIPSFHGVQSVTYSIPKWKRLSGLQVKAKHRYVAKQTRFDLETDLIPFSPPAYHLFGLEVGGTVLCANRQKVTLLISVDNLFNKEYKEYTNRFRYYAHDAGRDMRFMVVWEF